jgi:hypothetical protein
MAEVPDQKEALYKSTCSVKKKSVSQSAPTSYFDEKILSEQTIFKIYFRNFKSRLSFMQNQEYIRAYVELKN